MRFSAVLATSLCAVLAAARQRVLAPPNGLAAPSPTLPTTNSTFMQLIDHDDPSLGKFSQFYYYNDQYYKGPGSPIILFTPGEINVTGYNTYLTDERITGVYAKELGAGVIVLEHRYWGMSSPYNRLTTKHMQQLTLKNSIADLVYFAKNAVLPFDKDCTSHPDKAPWVLVGGSYSGALSAWTAATSPGTFWAYHASSAPVQAVSNYWAYFYPVQEGMAKNCSKDVALVVNHVDDTIDSGDKAAMTKLKTMFGLEDLEHDDDFASALQNGPWLWQGNQFYENEGFFDFCDAVENAVNASKADLPGPEGVGLNKALAGYASWFKGTLLPDYCEYYGYFKGTNNVQCFDTYDASSPLFTDHTLSNTIDRQWNWMLCNEPFGYWQDGAPADRPSIVSRHVNVTYWTRQCPLFFPDGPEGQTYGIAKGVTEADVNAYTQGWKVANTERLFFTNGQFDPWRESGVSSDFRPGGPLQSTAETPVFVVPGSYHASDLIVENGQVNAGMAKVQAEELQQIKTWVAEFKPS